MGAQHFQRGEITKVNVDLCFLGAEFECVEPVAKS